LPRSGPVYRPTVSGARVQAVVFDRETDRQLLRQECYLSPSGHFAKRRPHGVCRDE
jgi:hypothetical protein